MNLKKTRLYKDTFVGKGSQLAEALEVSDKAAKKVYDETTKRYEQQYPQDVRDYFAQHMKMHKHGCKVNRFSSRCCEVGTRSCIVTHTEGL